MSIIKKCGQCPNWEWFLDKNGIAMGRCTRLHIDEIPETKCACNYVYGKSGKELIKEQ